ncbi:MAG TPA: hypothetical protein VE422_29730 [Terriglobia bacterium]|nr:hypothetical protein [Terriglobia bacterium]
MRLLVHESLESYFTLPGRQVEKLPGKDSCLQPVSDQARCLLELFFDLPRIPQKSRQHEKTLELQVSQKSRKERSRSTTANSCQDSAGIKFIIPAIEAGGTIGGDLRTSDR